ncbi:prepilin-type N-terminal cleavage/methylation domain-containing protein [Thermus thermophilus]|uniref:Prepilin-type N-terminal cleavage/methylation domain-containing protein n=1 Tax=Thermus thermophilus JL-18 TaxID=798128 RepID=H9ZTR9_THETH|nr:prepilin-type N-terminal cleavage/methylation domain-containing protein [Thermus thermophilus JL-18]
MRRGLTLVELAVALALLGVLALGLSLLLGQMARGSQEAQEEAQLEADLQEVRARLTEDALRSTAFTCTGAQATLTLPSGTVTYEVSGGRVLRQGQPLTELSGYGGSFSCSGPALTLTLSRGSAALPPIRATRRVGLSVTSGSGLSQDQVPYQENSGDLQGKKNVHDLTWRNESGQTLWFRGVRVIPPEGNEVKKIKFQGLNGNCQSSSDPPGSFICAFEPWEWRNNAEFSLDKIQFKGDVEGNPFTVQLEVCLDSACNQSQTLSYTFVCDKNGCTLQ